MQRITVWATASAVALTLAVPLISNSSVSARGSTDSTTSSVALTDVRIEPIRLDCAVRSTDTRSAVRCEWSQPRSDRAAGVRLFRVDPAVEEPRQVVFRTGDPSETTFTDLEVRRGHKYAYGIVVYDASGRVVGRSRSVWVRIPQVADSVEQLRLGCRVGPAGEAIGCRWSRPVSVDAAVLSLWRSVDGGERELVERFRPNGRNAYRDPVPADARQVTYAVIATDTSGQTIARSRPSTVHLVRPEAGPL